ncbi:hypothetical protein H0H92_000487 [Tricholoma furcatifolium]|nr:hypothetical protein H0H92_000487 [Tricholoma furcatifolium]
MTSNRQIVTHQRAPTHRPGHIPSIPPVVMISTAKEIAGILRQRGICFAFCEDIAAYMYGVTRWIPRSIRIMVLLNEVETKSLSQSIAATNPDCWTFADSKFGTLTYLAITRSYTKSKSSDADASHSIRVRLTPTTRHPLHTMIFLINTLPLVPFAFILLEQLLDWDQSPSDLKQNKARVVMVMLRYFRSNSSKPYCKPLHSFDPVLHSESWDRVALFYNGVEAYLPEWKKLGFMHERKPSFDDIRALNGLAATTISTPSSTESSTSALTISDTLDSRTPLPPTKGPSDETLQSQSRGLFVKCTPRLVELLYEWDTVPEMKEEASGEIQAFLISIRMGKQTLVTGAPPAVDPVVHAQAHRYLSENKVCFLQWQQMGFFKGYSSKWDVPPPPPKSGRGYFLPPKRLGNRSTSSLGHECNGPFKKEGKSTRKSARQHNFGEARMHAANATVEALGDLGFSCAIFGSMACRLYGSPRLPNDVDILVLPQATPTTPDIIKDMLVDHSPDNFFLTSARDPSAAYRVLHYRPTKDASLSDKNVVKVDIVVPGIMNLPSCDPSEVIIRSDLPVIPFSVLLLQKLQAWDDHRLSNEDRYRKKVPIDVKDITWLLRASEDEALISNRPGAFNRSWFSESFMMDSKRRIKAFCLEFPISVTVWKDLGFAI